MQSLWKTIKSTADFLARALLAVLTVAVPVAVAAGACLLLHGEARKMAVISLLAGLWTISCVAMGLGAGGRLKVGMSPVGGLPRFKSASAMMKWMKDGDGPPPIDESQAATQQEQSHDGPGFKL